MGKRSRAFQDLGGEVQGIRIPTQAKLGDGFAQLEVGPGMIVFRDAGQGDIRFVPDGDTTILGTWAPDGRALSPMAPLGDFDSAQRSALVGNFVGLPVEGDWTLLVIDANSGGQVELERWGILITYDPLVPTPFVPEASSWWISGASVLALGVGLRLKSRSARSS